MDMVTILPYAIFGGISALIWFAVSHFSEKDDRVSERLMDIRDPGRRNKEQQEKSEGVSGMIGKAAPTLSKALKPKTELEESVLKVRMANAGFNSPTAPQVFLSIKLLSMILGVIIGATFGFISWGNTQSGWSAFAVGAGLGFYIPELVMGYLRMKRKSNIFLTMPDALDLLVVCVESGLGLDAGMRRVSEELEDTAPDICSEFNLANFQLQMGRPRREVLHDLGIRTGVDDMKALAAILIQADRFGSSIAQALRVQSDSMRVKRMQMAEEKAQKTAVQMIFPLVLFIFPGIFVVLVGPAAISMMDSLLAM
ncbi:type II secretion system F family protein [Rubinisphaera sp.]|uniref:type II secretion system F family protein n=1 Tax=Rubinisphaera sp. TaxID=2024857 RepID=UPI000C0C7302|nr:type II secretion system F family protein [Rubinisphaera sp.]MBV09791.1 secretion protein [Rubinisphaera sp.]HCS55003.1 secretion protein [Planctomycetaceae bacterium]|tara:strand:- start:16620 stop:17552 length:933 start_codon:yes stop_codon:yes gene_type:complete